MIAMFLMFCVMSVRDATRNWPRQAGRLTYIIACLRGKQKRVLRIASARPRGKGQERWTWAPVVTRCTGSPGSSVLLMKEPPESDPEAPCLWWRRGRVELPVQRKPPDGLYRLSWLFSCPPGGSQLHYWGASRGFLWGPLPAWGTPHLSFRRPSPAPEGGRGRRDSLVRPPERKLFRRLSFCHRISQVM